MPLALQPRLMPHRPPPEVQASPLCPAETRLAIDRIRLWHVVGWVLGAFFLVVAAAIVAEAVAGPLDDTLMGMVIVLGSVGGWLAWAVRTHRLSLAALFGPFPTRFSTWAWVAVAFLAEGLVDDAQWHLLVPWLEQAAPALADWYTLNAVDLPSDPVVAALRIAGAVVMAPLVEELLFRGVLFQRWAWTWRRPVWALVASSLAFAAMHGHVIGAFITGAVTTLLYVHAGSLWAPIALHAAMNGMAALGGVPYEASVEALAGPLSDAGYGVAALAASAVLLGVLAWRLGPALRAPLPYVWAWVPAHLSPAPTDAPVRERAAA